MKFSTSIIVAHLAAVSAAKVIPGNLAIKADSKLGSKLLSQARNLEQNEDEEAVSWVSGYSLKFQGCHWVQQWNDDADDEEDVKVEKKRLIRFRLCPTDSCSASNAGGCKDGYGDYVLDLNTYVDAYYQMTKEKMEQDCESFLNTCACNDDDQQDDGFDEEKCEYDCYKAAGMEADCVDRNPYDDDEAEQFEFEVEKYLDCAEFEVQNNNRRKLEEEEEEVQYFVGPHCAEQGGNIYLGLFTDDSCSEFADNYGGKSTFEELTGETLPYSSESLINEDCFSCLEIKENDNDDGADEENIWEQCEEIYNAAGKCEANLGSGVVDEKNENACSYIEGIKITRSDGVVRSTSARSNPVVTSFIVIFAVAFSAMGFYVYYLRTRLGVKKDTLM